MWEDPVKHYKFWIFSAKNFFSVWSTANAEPSAKYFCWMKFSTQMWISL